MDETRHGNEATTMSNTPGDLTQPTTSTHNNNANDNIENVITGNNDNDSNTNYLSKQTASIQRIINNTNNNSNNVISTSNANNHHDNNANKGNANENNNNFIDNNDNEDILSYNNTNHDYKGHGINAQITVTTTTATTSESDPVQEPITKHPRTSICTQGTSPRVVKISMFRYCYAKIECLVASITIDEL